MFRKKKPSIDKTVDSDAKPSEQSQEESPQDQLVWVHFRCGDKSGFRDCGVQFAAELPRWWADEFIRGEALAKCPACDSYGVKVLTTKEQLGLCRELTTIERLQVRCGRLHGHKGAHEHTWKKSPPGDVKTSTYTWVNEGEEEDEDE